MSTGTSPILADWFNFNLGNNLNAPVLGSFNKITDLINFGNPKFEALYCNNYLYDNKTDLFVFDSFKPDPQKSEITKYKKINTTLDKLLKENVNQKRIKEYTTKKANLENNMQKITRTKQFSIYPTDEQDIILKKWMVELEKCYNKCVDLYNKKPKLFESKNAKDVKLYI
jgi:hypothetical protein